jgi:hypothetical protein
LLLPSSVFATTLMLIPLFSVDCFLSTFYSARRAYATARLGAVDAVEPVREIDLHHAFASAQTLIWQGRILCVLKISVPERDIGIRMILDRL